MTRAVLFAYLFSKTTMIWTAGLTVSGVIVLTAVTGLLANTYGLGSGERVQIDLGNLLPYLQCRGPQVALKLLPSLLFYNYLRVIGIRTLFAVVQNLRRNKSCSRINVTPMLVA